MSWRRTRCVVVLGALLVGATSSAASAQGTDDRQISSALHDIGAFVERSGIARVAASHNLNRHKDDPMGLETWEWET